MKRLVLDLGTKTGFAVGGRDHVVSGCWSLKPDRWAGGGMVYVKFRQRLNELHQAYGIEGVAYEEVRRHAGTDAAHRYGGLQATLTAWCEENGVPYESVPVGTIKKHWTGNGNASKDMMIAEAVKRGFDPKDDNEADALALFDFVFARDEAAAAPVAAKADRASVEALVA